MISHTTLMRQTNNPMKGDFNMIRSFWLSLLCVFASAFLTVIGATFMSAAAGIEEPGFRIAFFTIGFTFAIMSMLTWTWTGKILWDSRWAAADYLAKRWLKALNSLPDNKDDCPPVMHSRHSKESHEMLERHLKKANLSPDDKPDDGWYD